MPGELPELTPAELHRYARHLVLPEVGIEGQRKLKAARVLCVGVGGLGSPVALYLAAAGVGHLTLADFDRVDETNLQRQVLFTNADVGQPKAETARERLLAANPHLEIQAVPERVTAANALDLVRAHDVLVDGTDNFPARYLLSDAAVLTGKPYVYGSIQRFEGQVSLFHPAAGGPCYRCLFPEPPPPGAVPSCAEAGVLGILPGVVGCLQATEAIKLILGVGDSLLGRLLLFDALAMTFQELRLRRNPACPACGENSTIRELTDLEAYCSGVRAYEIGAAELKARLDAGEPLVLLDIREPEECAVSALPGAHLIPMRQLEGRLHELDPQAEVVVYCRVGQRSKWALNLLRERGFARACHLRGGLLAWAAEVDPNFPVA